MENNGKHNKTFQSWKKSLLGISLFIGLLASPAFAASITLEGQLVPVGVSDFDVQVTYQNGGSDVISALDFTVSYDSDKLQFTGVTADLNLQASGKDVIVHEEAAGTIKGVIYGINTAPLATGDLFHLSFSELGNGEDGFVEIRITKIVAADGNASQINVDYSHNDTFLREVVIGTAPDVPTILNKETLINQKDFTLNWTDESASGAADYIVSKMAIAGTVGPLNYSKGLVSYWPLNELSGDASDVAGANQLSDINSVGTSADQPLGVVNGSRSFNAKSQQELTIPQGQESGLDFGGKMSLAGWIKANSLSSERTILSRWAAPGDIQNYYRLSVMPNGALRGVISTDGTTQSILESKAGQITAGTWHHVALSVDLNENEEPFKDISSNHHTLVPSDPDMISSSVKKFGYGSAEFNGINGSITVNDKKSWDMFKNSNDDWTMEAWIKLKDINQDFVVASQYVSGVNFWYFTHIAGKGLQVLVRDSGPYKIAMTGGLISDTNWHHVALIKMGSQYATYLDGAQVAFQSANPGTAFSSSLFVGSRGGFTDFSNGYMNEIRVQRSNVYNASPNGGMTDSIPVPEDALTADNTTVLLGQFGVASKASLYIDGVAAPSLTVTEEVLQSPVAGPEPFRVGAGIGGTNYMDGLIADLGYWNRTLAAEELAELAFANREMFTVVGTGKDEKNLEDGAYVYMVQSTNGTGAKSAHSLPFGLRVDTTPPAAPVVNEPQPLVNQQTIQVLGTTDLDSASVSLVGSEGVTIDQQPVLNGVNWTANVTVAEDGNHSVQAMATDGAGNLSEVTTHAFAVDTTAPVFKMASPAVNTYTVPRKEVNFQGVVDDLSLKSFTFRYSKSGGGSADVDIPMNSDSFNFNHTMHPGLNQFYLIAEDVAGNQTTEQFDITYGNNLPLIFDGLTNQVAVLDQPVSFIASISHQDDIDPELLTFSATGLPDENGSNPGTFDPKTRLFTWTPRDEQTGLFSVWFHVQDDNQVVSKEVKIVVQTELVTENDLNGIIGLPGMNLAKAFDYDKDGFEDIYEAIHGPNKLFRNLGDGTFEERAGTAGADGSGESNAVLAEDFNGDGWTDIYVVNNGGNTLLINNQDGTFSDKTISYNVGDSGDGRDAILEDFDGDGHKDLYVLNNGANVYYHNNGNKTFTDLSLASGLDDDGEAVNVISADFNSDNRNDIFVVNNGENELFVNQGANVFLNASEDATGDRLYDAFRGEVRDIDTDGDKDIRLVNHSEDVIYANDGKSKFKEIRLKKPTQKLIESKFVILIDYDNDGDLDAFVVDLNSKYIDGLGNVLFENLGDGSFNDVTAVSNLF